MSSSIVGWAHSPLSRLDRLNLKALITGFTRDAIAAGDDLHIPFPTFAGAVNMDGAAVANCISLLERTR